MGHYLKALVLFSSFIFCSFKAPLECPKCQETEDPYLVLAVEARGLDYSSGSRLIKTLAKHPRGGTKNSDVGHAWIYAKAGKEVICGGHSAERGELQPKYLEGVCLLAERGDPNPVRYLFKPQKDGFFEQGSGGHQPTFAAKIFITNEQFERIKTFLYEYPWDTYALSGRSCATLVAEIAALIDINLEHKQTLHLEKKLCLGHETLNLWEDDKYSTMIVSSPDVLEKSLIQLVQENKAIVCTRWLKRKQAESFTARSKRTFEDLKALPRRTLRWLYLYF